MNHIPAEQQLHRDAFGKSFTAWMRLNSWSQQTIHDAAKAWELQGPWNSQISLLQRGKHDPKPQFWVSLGEFNANVASGDLSAIVARGLRDRLKDSSPYLNANSDHATAVDFFAEFIGAQPANDLYTATPVVSDEDAKGISEMCRDAFRRIATDRMLSPAEAWESLRTHCNDLNADERARFREVLSGWATWSGDEVTDLSVPGQLGRPAQALEDWAGGNMTITPQLLRRG
jgi:hypothetical protein